jgi:hypothetical protein
MRPSRNAVMVERLRLGHTDTTRWADAPMDKTELLELTARRVARASGAEEPGSEDVRRVFDALFGTVEHPGTIAEALKSKGTVTLGSFGSLAQEDGAASFRPGKALSQYLRDEVA